MPRPWRLLIVCRGNTCRSPMAAAVLGDALARAGLSDDVAVGSAGIAPAAEGAPADPRARAALCAAGINLEAHAARTATAALLGGCDQILAVDGETLNAVSERIGPGARARTGLLGDYSGPTGIGDIADPFHGSAADYRRALAKIQVCVAGLVAELRRRGKG